MREYSTALWKEYESNCNESVDFKELEILDLTWFEKLGNPVRL